MNNNIILIAGGIAALFFLSSQKKCNAREVIMPYKSYVPQNLQGKKVCETELPALGFIQYQGIWYHRTQFPSPTAGQGQYSGYDSNSSAWQNVLLSLVSTGINLYNMFGNPNSGTSGTSGGSGGSGASGASGGW